MLGVAAARPARLRRAARRAAVAVPRVAVVAGLGARDHAVAARSSRIRSARPCTCSPPRSVEVAEQPSPSVVLPSSHSSVPTIRPSPKIAAHMLGVMSHVHPASTAQDWPSSRRWPPRCRRRRPRRRPRSRRRRTPSRRCSARRCTRSRSRSCRSPSSRRRPSCCRRRRSRCPRSRRRRTSSCRRWAHRRRCSPSRWCSPWRSRRRRSCCRRRRPRARRPCHHHTRAPHRRCPCSMRSSSWSTTMTSPASRAAHPRVIATTATGDNAQGRRPATTHHARRSICTLTRRGRTPRTNLPHGTRELAHRTTCDATGTSVFARTARGGRCPSRRPGGASGEARFDAASFKARPAARSAPSTARASVSRREAKGRRWGDPSINASRRGADRHRPRVERAGECPKLSERVQLPLARDRLAAERRERRLRLVAAVERRRARADWASCTSSAKIVWL